MTHGSQETELGSHKTSDPEVFKYKLGHVPTSPGSSGSHRACMAEEAGVAATILSRDIPQNSLESQKSRLPLTRQRASKQGKDEPT